MKEISLASLTLRNFKGIRNFTLETNGKDVRVFGDNAVGKSTLFDAFTWLLFDKDSHNNSTSNFKIKTLDTAGNTLHNLEHEVEGVLLIDGKVKTLRKVYAEKWTKKRGSAHSEFDGHTTDHFIDGVPSTKSEFTKFIDSVINENIFKLLTSPAFFNELHWKERRKILIEVCGDVSDQEVIISNKGLSKLTEILGDRSIDDHRKVIAARRSEINKELDKMPVRIDEANRSLPDVSDLDEGFLNEDIASVKNKIEQKEAELSRIQNGGEVSVKEKHQRELEGELIGLRNSLQSGTMDKVSELRTTLNAQRSKQSTLQLSIDTHQQMIEHNRLTIERKLKEADRLRNSWVSLNAEVFAGHHDDKCFACNQPLPEDQVKLAHDRAISHFNRDKAERLEAISFTGKAEKRDADQLTTDNANLSTNLESLIKQLDDKKAEVKASESLLETMQAGMTDVTAHPSYIEKQEQIEAVKSEILSLRSMNQGKIDQVRIDIAKIRNKASMLDQHKAKFSLVKQTKQRIEELVAQESELAKEFAKLEEELFLTEEFIRAKVSLLESKINSKFKHVRFKLFETQVNGGLEERCDTLIDGVPYGAGLNNAAEINAGLDIINTLSEYHGFTAPIFVDNAEAVTRMIDTQGQKISLIVSEQDKQLRVETISKYQEAI
jgi:DNA repair exonuclease SbcCD ATPase subunit